MKLLHALALLAGAVLLAPAQAQRNGGELVFPVPSEPPSYDGHREETFGLIHPVAPFYNTLLRVDPNDRSGTKPYPSIAESWTVSPDGKTYTFKIRRGVKFHDGSDLSARDVKASYDKIIFPPPGVGSTRKGQYADVAAVEAPDATTVVFRLKEPSGSFISSLLSPYNFIYKADILAKDPHWYEKNIMGTGPFTFVEHVKGSHVVGKKNPSYWDKGKPYLDSFRAIFMSSSSAQVAAVRGERAHIQFRGFTPKDRDTLKQALGDKITVQESPWDCILMVAINHEKKPFDDKRVRRALTLALDRHTGSKALSQIAIVKEVAGVQVPGTPFATPPEELNKLAGYWTDAEKSRAEARRLLKEAGVPEGFTFTFKNRGIPMPYEPLGVWRRHPQGRLRGGDGLPVRLHRRARPRHVQVPVVGSQPGELRALQGSGARPALRPAEPRDQRRKAQAARAPVREAAARRGGALPDDAAVAPHHPALGQGEGLDGHAEPLPQQHARHGLAGAVSR
ncbi:MAG: hypothetical protein K0R40_2573 [Burkholderiales bacterium]|nr:hypothetical protein [Burkholderiales bacterium]